MATKIVTVGMSRQDVLGTLGPADSIGATSRKYPKGKILLYGLREIHFGFDDRVSLIFHRGVWENDWKSP